MILTSVFERKASVFVFKQILSGRMEYRRINDKMSDISLLSANSENWSCRHIILLLTGGENHLSHA